MDVDRTPSLEDQVAELSGFDHVTYHIDDFGSSYVPNLGYVVCLLLTFTLAAFVWAVRALTQ